MSNNTTRTISCRSYAPTTGSGFRVEAVSALTSSDKPREQENTTKAEQALRLASTCDASQESLILVPNTGTKNNAKSLMFILFHNERKVKEVKVNRLREPF